MGSLVNYIYIVSGALFILSLKWMNSPVTARRGIFAGEAGMAMAIGGTLITHHSNWEWILAALLIGSPPGVPIAYIMPMTAVPQRTAMSHACGALAAALVGTAEYYQRFAHPAIGFGEPSAEPAKMIMVPLILETLLGFLTFTGSLMAMGKLQEILPSRPITYPKQTFINPALFTIAVGIGIRLILVPTDAFLFPIFVGLALVFGVLLIIPIGGADMPTVIALLNAYAGLSACAMGFALNNQLLVVAGALDGSSGLILSIIMCKAMNRSFTNVLFGAFGQVQASKATGEQRHFRSASPEEASSILESASSVIIVPGYGLAVAQAQHKIRDLFDSLTRRGVEVK